jgi:holliday junction DNA helicase RuvA
VIALLSGTVVAAGLGEVVLDVGGVGYQVHVPAGAAPARIGQKVALHTYLAVREDALTLYGFAEADDKALFEALLGVTGVGPKLALAALGALGATRLRRAVVQEDVAALTVIPGVGKKSAQRMILELRERLGAPGEDVPGPASVPTGARLEVREALAGLGYAPAEVQAALDALPDDTDAEPETLLRSALQILGKR